LRVEIEMKTQNSDINTAGIRVLTYESATIHPQTWGELTWFANRELENSEEVTVGRCVLNIGQSNPRHYHPNCSEVLVVYKGRIHHTIDNGGQTEMKEGDTVTIAPNVWHQATNIGDSEAVLIIIFSSADRETVGE
jgi:quercetin dioxygenase-like cupin family protein